MQFTRHFFKVILALVSVATLGAAGAAAAPTLTSVSVAPNPASAPASVVVTLQRTGGKCAVLVAFGNGATQHFAMQTPQVSLSPQSYPSPGSYTVTAIGKKKNNVVKCKGGPKTATLQVNGSGGGTNRPQVGPATPHGPLRTKKPQAGRAPTNKIRKNRVTTQDQDRGMRYKPTIQSALFLAADGGKYSAGLGQLAPRGRLILKGRGFDTNPGAIQLRGLPKGEVFLTNVKWSDTKVEGTLPAGLGGSVEKIYPVTAQVLRWEANEWSNAYPLQYQIPFEVKMINLDDSAVKVVKCGGDANTSVCNRTQVGDGCGLRKPLFVPPAAPLPTLYATHKNCPGAVGDDSGRDEYEIRLKNGWIVREVLDFMRKQSSSDEWQEHLVLTRGQKKFSVGWRVTPGDRVTYWYKINIVGPMGTSHK